MIGPSKGKLKRDIGMVCRDRPNLVDELVTTMCDYSYHPDLLSAIRLFTSNETSNPFSPIIYDDRNMTRRWSSRERDLNVNLSHAGGGEIVSHCPKLYKSLENFWE